MPAWPELAIVLAESLDQTLVAGGDDLEAGQLWTERDFDFKRNPKAAVAQSMGSVEDPVRTTT